MSENQNEGLAQKQKQQFSKPGRRRRRRRKSQQLLRPKAQQAPTGPALTKNQLDDLRISATIGTMLVPAFVIQSKRTPLPADDKIVINQIKDASLNTMLDPRMDPATKAQFQAAAILAAYEYGRTGALLPELQDEEE